MSVPGLADSLGDGPGLPGALADQVPLLRRAVDLDPAGLVRIRATGANLAVFVRLPFDVLVARTVSRPLAPPIDRTMLARELLGWLTEDEAEPATRDADWRGGLPPATGWSRVDTVPDDVVRDLVRKGAAALADAAVREGVPGAQPRSEVADALLNSVVLTLTADGAADGANLPANGANLPADRAADRAAAGAPARAEVTLRSLSALTRMGFLARGSHAHIDVSGRWTRIAGSYGSVFAERAGLGLQLR
jgi:hypothetical protein